MGSTTQIKVGSWKEDSESSKLIIVVNVVQHFYGNVEYVGKSSFVLNFHCFAFRSSYRYHNKPCYISN